MPDPRLDPALADASWLRRLARSLVRDAHLADDAAQETLAKALGPRAPGASLRAWLAAVLRNELRQDARSRSRRAKHELAAHVERDPPSPDDVSARLEQQSLLLDAVRALEEPYRSAIVARYLDELPPREIARRDSLPVRTVNTRLDRGLAKLARAADARAGGREAWLSALAPLAGAAHDTGWATGILEMTTNAKLAAAGGLALVLCAAWATRAAIAPARGAPATGSGDAAAFAAAPAGSAARSDALDSAELASAPEEPRPASRAAVEPVAASEPALAEPVTTATLAVHVRKRRSGVPPRECELLVTEAGADTPGAALIAGRAAALAEARIGATGAARVPVPAGRALWISVDPGRWEPPERGARDARLELMQKATLPVEPLAPGEERRIVVELEHGSDRALEGRVVAAGDGRPLAGARVVPSPPFGEALAADELGAFALPYASWDPPPSLSIEHPGFTPVTLRPRWVDAEPGVPLVIPLERAAWIDARVEAAGRDGVSLAIAASSDFGEGLRSSVALDAAGRAELSVPARHELALELRATDGGILWRDPAPWVLEPSERRELVVRLGEGTLVFGFLRDAQGAPIAEQELWAVVADEPLGAEDAFRYVAGGGDEALRSRTRGDGSYEFPDLASGAWWIGPASDGPWWREREVDPDAVAPLARGVTLPPGLASLRLDLVAHRGLWIAGRVEGDDGSSLPRSTVQCAPADADAGELQALTDESGEFRLGPLAPGEYRLRALGGDGIFGWPAETTRVAAGARDVVLVVPSRHSIGGRVVDREGRAVDAQVHLLRRNGSLGQSTSEREQGAFLFVALEPGTYSVQAEAPDGRVAVRRVELADGARVEDVALELSDGTRVGVSHDLAHGVRCAIWAGDALAADSTVRPGEESFETVPAGPLRVELYSGDGTVAVRELLGRAGRVETVAFDLEPGR